MRFRLRRFKAKIRRKSRLTGQSQQIVTAFLLALFFLFFSVLGYRLLLGQGYLDSSMAKFFLGYTLPHLESPETTDISPRLNFATVLYWLTNYDLQDPLSLFEAVLPLAPYSTAQLRAWEERPFVFIEELNFAPEPIRPPTIPEQITPEREIPKAPQILIYHTHSSEMYLGQGGQLAGAHYQFRNLSDPTITGVMAAGRHLAKALESLGIKTMHETRIHTLPTINSSYGNSEKTVREILSKGNNFDMVIDLHRDAGVPSPTTVINGRTVARIVLVVGTAENIPLSHPNYKDNLAFAQKIKSVCDEMYPGLMRPIQVQKEARYNQHLHKHSLIVELGSVENSLEEALLAAELLASVLLRVL